MGKQTFDRRMKTLIVLILVSLAVSLTATSVSALTNTFTITPCVTTGNPIKHGGIDFRQGDTVIITAGGCVQTGGSGNTWKRYVNPSGPNSDCYYFGSIYVPGVTNGHLVPIRDLVPYYGTCNNDRCTLRFTIPNLDTVPFENRFFVTKYSDDDYSDNGYWGHDDGTENQCKNVYNAYIIITRFRP